MQTNTNPNRFVFGAARGNLVSSTGNAGTQRPKAEYWLNVGYATGHERYDFVSLPMGIPMDAADKKELKGDPNSEGVQFAQAVNELFDEVMSCPEAQSLAPGQATIITIPLQIQLRRVKSDVDASQVDRASNPFRRPTAPAAQEATPAVAQQEIAGDPVF